MNVDNNLSTNSATGAEEVLASVKHEPVIGVCDSSVH